MRRHTEEALTRRHAEEVEDSPGAVTVVEAELKNAEAELKNAEAQLKNTEAELKNWEKIRYKTWGCWKSGDTKKFIYSPSMRQPHRRIL